MKKLNFRKFVLMLADIFIIAVSGITLNYFFSLTHWFHVEASGNLFYFILIDILTCELMLWIFGSYSRLWRYFNIHDYIMCGIATTLGFGAGYGLLELLKMPPRKVFFLVFFLIALFGVLLFRFAFKTTFLSLTREGKMENLQRTLIVGAGHAGRMIITEIRNAESDPKNVTGRLYPVGMVDDDPTKLHSKVNGVEVIGVCAEIPRICMERDVDNIIVAIPSCEEEEKRKILDYCSSTKCNIKVVPYLSDLLLGDQAPELITQAKEIKIEDLLGRKPIEFNRNKIAKFICDKVCMVTGGGGSIGSELVRQIAKYSPKQIIIVDIYENNAYDIQQELRLEYGDSLNLETLIASVRDYNKMESIFKKYQPQVVFHAAAHKHVPLMETVPEEAVKNNIFGTFNVATLAEYYKADKFVMISTDKAVNPTNVMGCSKRICEIYCQSLNNYERQKGTGETQFVTTRFGNVLGSNGSVIPLFKKQIEAGGPVTVTHPDIIRFFMLIPEACKLVLEAGTHGKGGEIFVFDMGKPVKIADLARRMILLSGAKNVEIKYSGLREGEKLYEEVLSNAENTLPSFNEKIRIAKTREYDFMEVSKQIDELIAIAHTFDQMAIVKKMKEIVPEYVSNNSVYSVLDKKG